MFGQQQSSKGGKRFGVLKRPADVEGQASGTPKAPRKLHRQETLRLDMFSVEEMEPEPF